RDQIIGHAVHEAGQVAISVEIAPTAIEPGKGTAPVKRVIDIETDVPVLELFGQMPFPELERSWVGATFKQRKDLKEGFRIARSNRLEAFRISEVEAQGPVLEPVPVFCREPLLEIDQAGIALFAQHLVESIVALA